MRERHPVTQHGEGRPTAHQSSMLNAAVSHEGVLMGNDMHSKFCEAREVIPLESVLLAWTRRGGR